ncbi:AraC family transcriptional regulator [Leuconostoc suionicum]|uniref:helix-turn-helix domain-containing protein n=2 Tax=Leuconostoc suionicum TaxID=1511761 RepID=UPI0024AD63D0|nr:AraC family transcriptional regulator [Leuconostoc suionicum]MDI6502267.1 AraC family transcriptional regulator [Leuconostoc suionicum]MDI6613286.1 AraC family transcriptional regulator [Leuconostoc suionicum]MDI6665158.1 AraC family transcriptional regulator [Leuconostoc suionicum]
MTFNIVCLFVLSRLKLLCQLIYETYTGKAAPNDDIFVVGAQPESIYLNDNSMQQDMISLNESNIYLLRTILSHNKKEFLNEKSKILKNKFLIHELNSEYSQNTLIEYTVLLTNILINNGYPRKDIYSIKTQIYRIISHNHSQTLNITLLDQIFCLFFNILLDETYTSELNLSQKIKNHIDRNISQSLTLPDIANNLNIPLKELNPQFKSKYKVTINQYIRKQKVSLSKSLLYATNLSLQDIATFVGFNSLSYFISTFKSIVGKTPAEYRKFCKENNTKEML